jgi:hypothetical protein
MRRAELRTTNATAIARWLEIYSAAGHPVEVEENHRLDVTDNEIVFRIRDWDAFTEVMDQHGENAEAS